MSRLGLGAWLTSLGLGTWAFHALGSGGLAAPPWRPSAFAAWLATTDPTVATMSLLRLVVLALAWYLVGVTTIGVLARLTSAARLVRFADALTVPAVRRLLQSALGLSLATGMAAAATPAQAVPLPMELLDAATSRLDDTEGADAEGAEAEAADPDEMGRADDTRGSSPPLVPLPLFDLLAPEAAAATADDGAADEAGTGGTGAGDASTARERRVADTPATTAAVEHEVLVGDSFWSIAEARVRGGEHATDDTDVARYWRRLVAENRSRLADPHNPDLLFPGQRIVLPPLEVVVGGGR
ncbi:LysM peptidoglycan-binding domain-containing protein [Egicoccus halophilus]|uniref:LysM peptidoglycan-binding domain-containing protein n=1 Tax=Egicoccus halophilus TaxID=1670830 RepID=UPI001031BDFD|nr:hypothetical protein [Egicoccus halophilus]